MDAINKLLDKARETRSLPSDLALAAMLGKSRQLVSDWRKGARQVQDDDIAQLAKIAHEDAGPWLLRIHAEQSHGPAAKEWAALLRRFGAAAALAVVALLPTQGNAHQMKNPEQSQDICIMRNLT